MSFEKLVPPPDLGKLVKKVEKSLKEMNLKEKKQPGPEEKLAYFPKPFSKDHQDSIKKEESAKKILEIPEDIELKKPESVEPGLSPEAYLEEIKRRQEQKEQSELISELGSLLHNEWRAPRKKEDGSFEPRIKVLVKTGEGKEKWFDEAKVPSDATELKRQDIANTDFKDLDSHWQYENKASAEVAVAEVEKAIEAESSLDESFIEAASSTLHDKWLERNGSWAPPEQNKPYAELSEEEKEKDRVIIRKAIMGELKRADEKGKLIYYPKQFTKEGEWVFKEKEKKEPPFNSQEHTRWAKQRALELLKEGNLKQAIDSMVSDLAKDPTRSREQVNILTMTGMITRDDSSLDEKKVREFIEGFAE